VAFCPHAAALAAWKPSELPEWLNEEAYRTKIQPALAGIAVPAIATALGVSQPYATDIRAGKRTPHPRHWLMLARIGHGTETVLILGNVLGDGQGVLADGAKTFG
jgi:hypothetical protein